MQGQILKNSIHVYGWDMLLNSSLFKKYAILCFAILKVKSMHTPANPNPQVVCAFWNWQVFCCGCDRGNVSHTQTKTPAGITCAGKSQSKSHPSTPCPEASLPHRCFCRQLTWFHSLCHIHTEVRVESTLRVHLFPCFSPALARDAASRWILPIFWSRYCWTRTNTATQSREVMISFAKSWWDHSWKHPA